jgi:Flp pilus assembly protein TadB
MVAQSEIVGDWGFGLHLHHILHLLKRIDMDNKDITNNEEFQKAQMAQINKALAVFLLFFGAVVISAIFFTETFVGKMTNLTAGMILVLIGAILILQTKRSRRTP